MDNDLISRTALKASIFDMPKPKGNLNFWDGVDACGDIIDNAPAVSNWVPVSERLPKKDGRYFVTQQYCDFRFTTVLYWQNSTHDFGVWVEHNDSDDWIPVDKIIAWQSLPETYKGE